MSCVSGLMPCRNAFPYLPAAAESVLGQSDCFECPTAVGVRAMAVLGFLNPEQRVIKRVRAASRADAVFNDSLNKVFQHAYCLLIGWLHADDPRFPRSAHSSRANLSCSIRLLNPAC